MGFEEFEVNFSRTDVPDHSPTRKNFAPVNSQADLANLTEFVRIAHLNKQEMVNIRTIQEILRLCPNLERLQVIPSLKRLVGRRVVDLLTQRQVKLSFERMRNEKFYDQAFFREEEYEEKRQVFLRALNNPRKRQTYELMRKHEFDEVYIAESYFGDKRRSLISIAENMGMYYVQVSRKLSALLIWMGYDAKSKEAIGRARNLEPKVQHLERPEQNRKEKEKLRKELSVGDLLPPDDLPVARYEMWQKINRLILERPELFQQLRDDHPGHYEALATYYLLDRQPAKKTLVDLAKAVSRTHQRLYQRKNQALANLGLLE